MCSIDHLFFMKNKKENFVMQIIYVDDILITGNNEHERPQEVMLLLGIRTSLDKKRNNYASKKYLTQTGAKDVVTPIEINLKLQSNEGETIVDKTNYQRLIGKLIYLTTARPDITQ